MNRIWCEHLPFDELNAPATVNLLKQFDVSPIIAVRPDSDAADVSRAISLYLAAGLQPGIWPLLGRNDGYWPSERTATVWCEFAERWLDELDRVKTKPVWLAVDLEPPLAQATRLLRDTLRAPIAAWELGRENMDAERYARSLATFREFCEDVRARHVSTLAVTLPAAAHDLRDDVPLWQDMFETPWADIGWDASGIMAYGSIVSGASRGILSAEDARAIHQPLLARVSSRFGAQAHASLGITGVGVFGDEPVWPSPSELEADVAAARAAGIRDLAVFCLEGVLDREHPERWLAPLRDARARAPKPTWKADVVRQGARVARRTARWWFVR